MSKFCNFGIMNISSYNIVLASNSPRRKELLSGIDIDYEIRLLTDVDETYPDDMNPEEVPEYLSRKKAEANVDTLEEKELLLTADTIVLLDGEILGKPGNVEETKAMLCRLSGKTHLVITGVSLTSKQKQVSFSETTKVTFSKLTSDEIDYYSENYNPTDKAGAYGVQEWIGYVGVERLEGSYFNVMGLPIGRVYKEIRAF